MFSVRLYDAYVYGWRLRMSNCFLYFCLFLMDTSDLICKKIKKHTRACVYQKKVVLLQRI